MIRDVYQKIINPEVSQRRVVFWGKMMTVIVGVGALVFAVSESKLSELIFWFVVFAWSGIGAAFCPMMIMSLFWKGTTKAGAVAGMCSGFLITLAWVLYFEKGTALLDMMAVPGFFGALAVIWLVSLFTMPPEKAAEEHAYVKEAVRSYRIG